MPFASAASPVVPEPANRSRTRPRGRGHETDEVAHQLDGLAGWADVVVWLARKDSNLRSPDPESGALPLGHSPVEPVGMIPDDRLESVERRPTSPNPTALSRTV